jgi:cytochrome c-type biogenesis protein CcmH/NrfF
MNRPTNDTESRAMKELMCPCGCARQSIESCDCATAAQLRAKVQGIMAGSDLSTDANRQKAYDGVLTAFTKDYGAKVLLTPKSDASWIFPAVAALGALALLIVAGRRWVSRGNAVAATTTGAIVSTGLSDDEYSDKLDDELSETD